MTRAAAPTVLHSFEQTLTKRVTYHYLLYLPDGYETQPNRKWPVLFFLHGSGERGVDPWLVAKHGPPKLRRGGTTLSADEKASAQILAENFIVVAPQCAPGDIWHDDETLALIDQVKKNLRTDEGRTYLTGLSMGGFGTWTLGVRHPERFAAIVPICGGGEPLATIIGPPAQRAALITLGVWAFHGAKDPTVPLAESQRMIDWLKFAGAPDLKLTVYPEALHDSWTAAYANPELYRWLLRHTR